MPKAYNVKDILPVKEIDKFFVDMSKNLDKIHTTLKAISKTTPIQKGSGAELEKLKKQLESLKGIKKENNRIDKEAEKRIQAVNRAREKSSVEVQKLKVKTQEKNQEAKKAAQIQLTLAKAHEKGAKSIQRLKKETAAMNAVRERMIVTDKKSKKEFDKLTNSILRNEKQIKRYDKAVGRSQRNVGNYAGAVRNLVGAFGLVGGITLFANALRKVGRIVVDFQKSASKLGAIGGFTTEELKKLTEQSKKLGSVTQFTASQILALDTELAKLGFTASEIEDSVPGIQSLASATGIELAEAAKIAGATLNIFSLKASEAGRVSDILALSTTKSALDMQKLSTALPIVGKTADIAGKSLEKTVAQLGILSDNGIDASTSATALRNIFLELSKKGLTMEEALEKINKSTDKNKTSMALFGKRASSVGVILAETGGDVDILTQKLIDSGGASEEMSKKMLDNISGDLTLLTSAWEGYILSVEDGEGDISKAVRGIIQFFTKLIGVLTGPNGITEAFKQIKNAFKGFFAALGELADAFKGTSGEGITMKDVIDQIGGTFRVMAFPIRKLLELLTPVIKKFAELVAAGRRLLVFIGFLEKSQPKISTGLGEDVELTKKQLEEKERLTKKYIELQRKLVKASGAERKKILADIKQTEKEIIAFAKGKKIGSYNNLTNIIDKNTDAIKNNNKEQDKAIDVSKQVANAVLEQIKALDLINELKKEQKIKEGEDLYKIAVLNFEKQQAIDLKNFAELKSTSEQRTEFDKIQANELFNYKTLLEIKFLELIKANTDESDKVAQASLATRIQQLKTELAILNNPPKSDTEDDGKRKRTIWSLIGLTPEEEEKAQEIAEGAKQVLNEIFDAQIAKYKEVEELSKKRIADLEEELRVAESSAGKGRDAKVKALKEELLAEKRKEQESLENQEKAARRKKALAITEAVIGLALGVVNSLSEGGIFGILMAIVVAAAGAIQIAKIKSAKYADGTEFVQLGGNKPGVDTVPAMLTAGEKVLSVEDVKGIPKGFPNKLISTAVKHFLSSKAPNLYDLNSKNLNFTDMKSLENGQKETNKYLKEISEKPTYIYQNGKLIKERFRNYNVSYG